MYDSKNIQTQNRVWYLFIESAEASLLKQLRRIHGGQNFVRAQIEIHILATYVYSRLHRQCSLLRLRKRSFFDDARPLAAGFPIGWTRNYYDVTIFE